MTALQPANTRWHNLPGRAIFISTLILLLGILIWKAGKEALSDVYLRTAVLEFSRPVASAPRSQEEKWLQTKQYLTNSLRYAPRNARALDEAGTHDLRGMRARIDRRSRDVALRSAYENFRRQLALRPTSPNGWANLAMTKFFMAEWDDEMFDALRHADDLGPWELDIQHMTLFVRLNIWARLDPAQRAAAAQTVKRVSWDDVAALVPLLRLYSRLDLLCDTGLDSAKVLELCNQLRKAGQLQAPSAR